MQKFLNKEKLVKKGYLLNTNFTLRFPSSPTSVCVWFFFLFLSSSLYSNQTCKGTLKFDQTTILFNFLILDTLTVTRKQIFWLTFLLKLVLIIFSLEAPTSTRHGVRTSTDTSPKVQFDYFIESLLFRRNEITYHRFKRSLPRKYILNLT